MTFPSDLAYNIRYYIIKLSELFPHKALSFLSEQSAHCVRVNLEYYRHTYTHYKMLSTHDMRTPYTTGKMR